MVVSDRFRFIFVHIPKSGGTSCGRALRRALPFYERRHWVTHHSSKHLQLDEVLSRMQVRPPARFFWQKTKGDPTTYFRFAFVRDPWDRMVSLFHYLQRSNAAPEIADVATFADFMDRVAAGEPWIEKMYSLQPQLSYISNEQGELLVDYVGRFERLTEDFEHACDRIGVKATLPHVNASSHAHYRTYYTPETAELIHDRFREDVETFGYTFGEKRPLQKAA